MKKTRKINSRVLLLVIFLIFLRSLSSIEIINATGIGPIQRFSTNFTLREYSKFESSIQNENSLNISLPSSSWALQDIELNFTDIKFGIENNTIEEKQYGSSYRIFHQNSVQKLFCIGVQIQLNISTQIYGVYIYASMLAGSSEIIQFQIRGYNSVNDTPNSTIYRSTNFNVDTQADWYFQNFSTPISLPKGNYYLVLNGTNIPTGPDDEYYWYYNDVNPKNPNLNVSRYINPPWTNGLSGDVPLYKLVQRVNLPLYPEAINMSVSINNQFYSIYNNTSEGEGYLPKNDINFSPNSDSYQISVYNNATESLFFNVSYSVTLTNNIISPSVIDIQKGVPNIWSTEPAIIKQPTNYSVVFNYPDNWENISILRTSVNITSSVLIDAMNHKIILFNDSITTGADWEIVAYTPNFKPELNVLKSDYNLGQEIQFSLQAPILSGTYTFVLLDSAGIPIQNQTLNSPPDSIFSYNLSLSDLEGNYTAYVFWFSASETNAGVQTQEFLISSYQPPVTPPPETPIPLIILSIVLGAATVGSISFITLKRVNSIRRTKLEKFLNKCTDISIINDVIVIDSKSGIDVFSQSFGGRNLDTSLISGFLQAISNFGSAISEAAKESRTLTIEYKDSIVMQTEFVNLKLIVTLKENPSANFKFLMEDLAYDIYKQYGQEIDKFTGILKPFHNMNELIEKHLNVSFIYPLTIFEIPKIKLTTVEKDMVNKARIFMRENNFNHFYSLYLLPENSCTPKDYQTIMDLIEKGVFKPQQE